MPTILLLCGKVNFTNLSRYSELSEKTYRRHYSQPFDFVRLNTQLIEVAIPVGAQRIGAMDCSFIPKSGKQTYGLDWFYNGSASRTEKGLEISVIAIVDVAAHQGYTLSVQQTPAQLGKVRAKSPAPQPPGLTLAVIEAARVMLQTRPPAPTPVAVAPEITRIDHYLQQLQATPWPADVTYLAVDGYYSKLKFVDGVVAQKLHVIGKLRHDADLRYLYTGPQKARGAKRKYDGKVDLQDRTRFTHVCQLEPQVNLYTAVVWHVSLKRKIRLACLVDTRKPGKTGFALLFSTDVELAADLILTYYKARYQIEISQPQYPHKPAHFYAEVG